MTTVTGPPITALRTLALAHLEDLHQKALAAERAGAALAAQRAANDARESVVLATGYADQFLPATLARVLSADQWTGYPSLPALATRTAAAPLGQDVWAVFHRSPTGDNQLYLTVPCPCRKYILRECPTDEVLARVLLDIARWQTDPVPCTRACSDGDLPEWMTDGS
jgi:hypothetical protein